MASTHRHEGQGWAATSPVAIMVATLALIVGLWWMLLDQLERNRNELAGAARINAANLALAFEEHVVRTIRSIDGGLLHLRIDWQTRDSDFQEDVRNMQNGYDAGRLLQIAVIGKDGRLVFSNLRPATGTLDLSDRDYFRFQRASSSDSLYISRPVLGRVSGRWSIQFARKISAADGGFDGVLVASLDPGYLSGFYESVDIGQRGAVTLIGLDGIVRARGSKIGNAGDLGQMASADQPYLQAGAPRTGMLKVSSPIDGVTRVLAYRRLADYPLVVLVGLATDDIFAAYEVRKNSLMLLGGALTFVFLIGGAALARAMLGQHRYRQFLLEDRALLAAANDQLTAQQERLRFVNDSLRLLNQIVTLPHTCVEDKIAAALGLGRLHLGLDFGIFSRVAGQRYVVEHCCTPPKADLKSGDIFKLDHTYCSIVLAAGDVVAVGHLSNSAYAGHACHRGRRFECYIGVPVVVQGNVYGTIAFAAARPYGRQFDEGDLEFMRLVALWTASALTEEQSKKKLLHIATTDSLTQVWNRHHFLQEAGKEMARASRYHRPMVVVMLDIDRFKQINDMYGHQAGDEALAAFAEKCQETLRAVDLFGRLGGEEFAAILVETGAADAAEACERLRRAVAGIEIRRGGETLRFTVSIGYAEFCPGEDMDAVFGRADEALYRAKSGGRNRVVAASPGMVSGDVREADGLTLA